MLTFGNMLFRPVLVSTSKSRFPVDIPLKASIRNEFASQFKMMDGVIGIVLIIIGSLALTQFGWKVGGYVGIGLGAFSILPSIQLVIKNYVEFCRHSKSAKGSQIGQAKKTV